MIYNEKKLDEIKYRVPRTCVTCVHFDEDSTHIGGFCNKHEVDVSAYGKCSHGHKLDKVKLHSELGEFSIWIKE